MGIEICLTIISIPNLSNQRLYGHIISGKRSTILVCCRLNRFMLTFPFLGVHDRLCMSGISWIGLIQLFSIIMSFGYCKAPVISHFTSFSSTKTCIVSILFPTLGCDIHGDSDCPGIETTCIDGYCHLLCEESVCSGLTVCREGVCVLQCEEDTQCLRHQVCDTNVGGCITATNTGMQVRSSFTGWSCNPGYHHSYQRYERLCGPVSPTTTAVRPVW